MNSRTLALWTLLAALAGLSAPRSFAGPAVPIEYQVILRNPQTQMVSLSMRVADVDGPTVDFCLPIWRPGRYVVIDPASTIRDVQAAGDDGRTLDVNKTDKSTWRVSTGGSKTITLTYQVYANSLADRTRHVDDSHAFLSPSMVFMYVPQRRSSPITVSIDAPKEWRIACGLNIVEGKANMLAAPNYDVLVDSPLEIGVHDVINGEAYGKPFQIVIWGNYPHDVDRDKLKADFTKIMEAACRMFGRVPYDRYLFIMHVGAGATGGTEHLNSTVIQTSRSALDDPGTYNRFLNLVAHEFFHTWNVKQFRPDGIYPYDYQHENYTKLLWVCEGTTTYYSPLLLARSGLRKPEDYLDSLEDNIQSLRTRPAETVQSLEQSSFDSWIHFSRSTPDDANNNVSFYSKGALVSLLLDMYIREKSHAQASLDTVMRKLYDRYPLSGPGYTTESLIGTINEVTNTDAGEFFEKYVSGAEPLPLEDALRVVGLELYFKPNEKGEDAGATSQPVVPGTLPSEIHQIAYLGLNIEGNIVSNALADGPAYAAGLIAGDEILAIDGRRLNGGGLQDRLKKCKPGQIIAVLFSRREEIREINITLAGRPDGSWAIRRLKNPTPEQQNAYRSWLGQAWPE